MSHIHALKIVARAGKSCVDLNSNLRNSTHAFANNLLNSIDKPFSEHKLLIVVVYKTKRAKCTTYACWNMESNFEDPRPSNFCDTFCYQKEISAKSDSPNA